MVELLMAIAIFGLIAAGATSLLSASLGIQAQGEANYKLYQEGLIIMERLTSEVKTTTLLHIPNNHTPTRDILALSSNVNDDSDHYFNDTLFPRIDEDGTNPTFTTGCGIPGLDDNGNGEPDDCLNKRDEDEDNIYDEEELNGIDDDNDGNIDEDLREDNTWDGASGIAGMDDDGDGNVDEDNYDDDDEDGFDNEDSPNIILYCFGANDVCPSNTTLYKITPDPNSGMTGAVSTPISERVTFFETFYEDPDKILIKLWLTDADGNTVKFREYVSPRNRLQKTGKRVK